MSARYAKKRGREDVSEVKEPASKRNKVGTNLTVESYLSDSHSSISYDEWISGTSVCNHLLRDPIIDWLQGHHQSLKLDHVDKPKDAGAPANKFLEFLFAQGNMFEKKIVEKLKKKFGSDFFDIGGTHQNCRSKAKVRETYEAMKNGIPIIYSGTLHNPTRRVFGIPDLMVRSDWLKKIVIESPITDEEAKVSSKITKGFHYRVIDIKFTTLQLRADGEHLLNASRFPAYKGQLEIYNAGLEFLQGYDPKVAYILGRKWTYTKCGEKKSSQKKNAYFDLLAKVDFRTVDSKYLEKNQKAIDWVRDVRKNGGKWSPVGPVPLAKPELYPNMSNSHDAPWRPIKEKIADEIKEISSLWMCGVNQREKAHASGVYRWDDEKCTTDVLGINGAKTKPILDSMLAINRSKTDIILPKYLEKNIDGWMTEKLVFFVDFEALGDLFTNFSEFDEKESEKSTVDVEENLIYLIGVMYVDPDTGKKIYRSFLADALTQRSERKMCKDFAEYVNIISAKYKVKDPLLMHWSRYEQDNWENVADISRSLYNASSNFIWFDMMTKLFKETPIVIKGCFSYSLKSVVKALNKHKLMNTSYSDLETKDGMSSMVVAYKYYCNKDQNSIDGVIEYNRMDVEVMCDILTYLRKSHIEPLPSEEVMPDISLEESSKSPVFTTSRKVPDIDLTEDDEIKEVPRKRKRLRQGVSETIESLLHDIPKTKAKGVPKVKPKKIESSDEEASVATDMDISSDCDSETSTTTVLDTLRSDSVKGTLECPHCHNHVKVIIEAGVTLKKLKKG